MSDLAQKVDLTLANLSRIKNGRAKALRLSTLEALCRALDCTPGDLLEYLPRNAKSKAELARLTPHARHTRFLALHDAAESALEEKAPARAKWLAEELLALAPEFRKNWNYGNAVHHGHAVLGRIALAAGKIRLAESHLLRSGKTPGSPQLDSFGPSFILAKGLIDRGRSAAVLRYLKLCARFWKMDYGHLEKWRIQVEAGELPDFRANCGD